MRPDVNIPIDITKIVWSLSGISVFFIVPVLNQWCWFLGVIILFYLLFPALSYFMDRHPYSSIIGIMAISITTYLLNVYPMDAYSSQAGVFDIMNAHNFPLSNLFSFSLGVFIIRMGFYPKIMHNLKFLSFISALTYPIYLIHGFLLGPYIYPLNISLFALKLILLSVMLYILDKYVQNLVRNVSYWKRLTLAQ